MTKPEDQLFIEYHFLAQITLRTLINRARGSAHQTSKFGSERQHTFAFRKLIDAAKEIFSTQSKKIETGRSQLRKSSPASCKAGEHICQQQ